MSILSIDIETYSSMDLTKCGVYAYTQSEDFEILLLAYAFDDEEVKIIDFKCGESIPIKLREALTDKSIIKTAFNANFERTCLGKYFNRKMPPEQWRCTAVHALSLGLPQRLESVAKCLNLKHQKMNEGKALIRYFSMPCKGTKVNGNRMRNLPKHDMNKWNLFKSYCIKDVEVEREIRKYLDVYPIIDWEYNLWCLDQKINDTGVLADKVIIDNALICDSEYQEKLNKEAISLTGIQNPNSTAQLKKWLKDKGIEVETLTKEIVKNLLEEVEDEEVKVMLQLRQELSKTSVRKYEAMERAICEDNRIRGLLQFYGASRTGRWAGRLVQVQNLPQNKLKDLELARNLLKEGNYDLLNMLFYSVSDLLSQLIRTVFIPSKDSRFIVADFSAIEARVIAWLAGETWRMNVFNSHGKIYEASAAKMFKIPIENVTKELRQKGKIAELALGYQGSSGALISMGAIKMGLLEEDLLELVWAWRSSNKKIVALWNDIEDAAISAISENIEITIQHNITFTYESGILFIKLPSGRRLSYIRPRVQVDEKFNKSMLTYEGIEQGTKQWGRLKTYGGKLTENIVQAIARDCLAESMLRLNEAGYKIVMHVHDEVILDTPNGFGSLDEVNVIMATPILWAKELPLRAESFETKYYKKD